MNVVVLIMISNVIFALLGYKAGKTCLIINTKENESIKVINPIGDKKDNEYDEEEAEVPDEREHKSFF